MRYLLGLFLLCFSWSAAAAPSVFVRGDRGYGWWLTKMEGRILTKAVGAVTTEAVNRFIEETQIYSPYKICALGQIEVDTFVGLDKATQSEIDASRPQMLGRIEIVSPDGRKLVGRGVVFEGCDSEGPKGAALLVTDAATNDILRWEPMDTRTVEETEIPTWVLFLQVRSDDELFSYSTCLECGAQTAVYYDVTRKKVYTEYNGH